MSEQGKKKLKALRRAQQEAARFYRAQLDTTEVTASPADPAEPVAVDRFLQAYGELTDATVELYRRLDPQDPRHQQVRSALAHALRSATSALTDVEADAETDAEPDTDDSLDIDSSDGVLTSSSIELVRIQPAPSLRLTRNLPVVVRRMPERRLPDQSSIVRYARVRRATRRWPDESWLQRYLRERPLPDESTLHRYIRRRRELYQLYG
jgi:hypothetical protein